MSTIVIPDPEGDVVKIDGVCYRKTDQVAPVTDTYEIEGWFSNCEQCEITPTPTLTPTPTPTPTLTPTPTPTETPLYCSESDIMTWDESTMNITADSTAHGAPVKLVDGSGMGAGNCPSSKHERVANDDNMWVSDSGDTHYLSIDLGSNKVVEYIETIPYAHSSHWGRSMKTVSFWTAKDGASISAGTPSEANGWTQVGTGTVTLNNPQAASGSCMSPAYHNFIGDGLYTSEFPREFRYFGIVSTESHGGGDKHGLSEIIFNECAPRPTPTPTPTPTPCDAKFELHAELTTSGSRTVTNTNTCGEGTADCPEALTNYSGATADCAGSVDWPADDMGTDSKWELYAQDYEQISSASNWINSNSDSFSGVSPGEVIYQGFTSSGSTELSWSSESGGTSDHAISTGNDEDELPGTGADGHGYKFWYGIPGYDYDAEETLDECVASGAQPTVKSVRVKADSGVTAFFRSEDGSVKEKCYLAPGESKTFTLTADAGMTERNTAMCECGQFVCSDGYDVGADVIVRGYDHTEYGEKGSTPYCGGRVGTPTTPAGDKLLVVCGDETSSSAYSGFTIVAKDD